MEELLLGGFLTGDKLNIIDEEQVAFPVFAPEFDIFAVGNGGNQLIGELVALDVDDVGVGVLLADAVGNGVEQMGLAHTGGTVDKQRIVNLSRGLGYGNGRGMGKPVGGAHHEIIKGELGVEVHGGGSGLSLIEIVFPLLVSENQQFGVGIENFLQGILNVVGAPAADDLPAEVGRGVQNQIVFVQLHHLRVIEPGRHGHSPQPLLHMAEDLCPDIGR